MLRRISVTKPPCVQAPKVRQVAANIVAGVAAMMFVSPVSVSASCEPPSQDPSDLVEQIVYMESTEIPKIYENLPEDNNAADSIVNVLDDVESQITTLQTQNNLDELLVAYLEEELSTIQ